MMIWLMVINGLNYQIIIFLLSWFLTYNILFTTLKHLKLYGVLCVCVCVCVCVSTNEVASKSDVLLLCFGI